MSSHRSNPGRKQQAPLGSSRCEPLETFPNLRFPRLEWLLEQLLLQSRPSRWRITGRWLIEQLWIRRTDRQLRQRREIPDVEILEARALLSAAFTQSGTTLNISLNDNQLVAVEVNSSGYLFTLSNSSTGNTWSGTATSWAATSGTRCWSTPRATPA